MHQAVSHSVSPFSIANVRRFILFRCFFNSRFYYPVFTILYLDFGLTLTQFALLNAVWAATIVLLEVPSGALADTIGRKNLVVLAALMMVIELSLLCFLPLGNSSLIFGVFLFNRVLSGVAEAAASGADEALAYDSLAKEGNKDDWGKVYEKLMRTQSICFIVAMSLGAVMYDPKLMQQLIGWFGLTLELTQQTTMRFPLYGTLVLGFLALYTSIRMEEVHNGTRDAAQEKQPTTKEALRVTLHTGAWILRTPMPLAILLFGMLFDHSVRLILTITSQYYRTILLPEAVFGLISSGMALLGIIVPRGARWLAENKSPAFNTALLGIGTMLGFCGLSLVVPYAGILPMVILSCSIKTSTFLVSHYLNAETSAEQRATVLSFRGLSNNFAYGLIGVLYSLLLAGLKGRLAGVPDLENTVFIASLGSLPWYFLTLFILFWVYCRWRLGKGIK